MRISLLFILLLCLISSRLQAQSVDTAGIIKQNNNTESGLIISSVINLNGHFNFSVYDAELKRRFWIRSGRTYKDYTFLEYNTDDSSVSLIKDNQIIRVPIIKANDRPIQLSSSNPSKNNLIKQMFPSTVEIEAFKQDQYKKLPAPDTQNYKLLRNSADNRINNFAATPIENTFEESVDDISNRSLESVSTGAGGRTQKTKVKTTIHSSVFQESQKQAED